MEDGYSKAALYEFKRQPDVIPDIKLQPGCEYLIDMFWEMRSFVGAIDSGDRITMSVIRDWESHNGFRLEKWERQCMFSSDRALSVAYGNVLKWHSKRDKIKKDKK